MIEQKIRGSYQSLLVMPVAARIKYRLSPNLVTYISGLFGLLVLPALLLNYVALAIGLLLLSGYCDTLDGTLARITGRTSDWGTVLDIMTDRFVEVIVVLALFLVDASSRGLGCILMLTSMLLCITSFLVVGIFSTNDSQKSFHYSPGFMERAEAFVFFSLMMLWPSAFVYLAVLFTLLVTATATLRLYQFKNLYYSTLTKI